MDDKQQENKVDDQDLIHMDVDSKCMPTFGDLPNHVLDWIDNNSNDLFGLWDSKGLMKFVSNNTVNVLGYTRSNILGRRWRDLLSEEEYQRIQTVILTKEEKNDFVVEIYSNSGKPIFFECLLEKVPAKGKGDFYYLCLFRDISYKVQTDEMIIHSEKMSVAGQLAAGIAHEIRNPLTSLKGFLQLIQAGVQEKEIYYQIMTEEIEKIELITSELLFISKPLTNKRKKESINSMLEDVIILLNSQAQSQNIQVLFPKTKEFHIYCDRSQMKQIFLNILKNAIEATEKSGSIEIEVKRSEQQVQINVIDEGPGVSEDMLDKINEPFFTTKETGTGLGLIITKQILDKHEGTLKVIQNKTKGSTFRIVLPSFSSELN